MGEFVMIARGGGEGTTRGEPVKWIQSHIVVLRVGNKFTWYGCDLTGQLSLVLAGHITS